MKVEGFIATDKTLWYIW